MKNLRHAETFLLIMGAVFVSHYIGTPSAKHFLATHQSINDLVDSLILAAVVAFRIAYKYNIPNLPSLSSPTPRNPVAPEPATPEKENPSA